MSTRRSLVKFFGADKGLRSISQGDADDWRLDFVKRGEAENTIRKRNRKPLFFPRNTILYDTVQIIS